MSVLAIFTGDITPEQYEALRKEVNWEGQNPDGGIFHCASFDDSGGIHVADVWTSVEAMNAFVGSRLAPAMQKLHINPPNVEIYEAANVNAYRRTIQEYEI